MEYETARSIVSVRRAVVPDIIAGIAIREERPAIVVPPPDASPSTPTRAQPICARPVVRSVYSTYAPLPHTSFVLSEFRRTTAVAKSD